MQDLSDSSYYSVASQYSDWSGNIGTHVTYGGTWLDQQNAFPSTTLTYDHLLAEVGRALTAQGWARDANSYFQIYTPAGITDDFNPKDCGHHTYQFNWLSPHMAFGLVLYPVSGCFVPNPFVQSSTPNGSDGIIDSAINISAHEIIETATNPFQDGWWDCNGNEIADLCLGNLGPTDPFFQSDALLNGHLYLLQKEWSNAASGCVMAYTSTVPSISGISPSPVPGSANVQTITINGSNFLNKPWVTVTWSGGGKVLASSQVTYVSSTQVQISILTSTTADNNWTVRVTNPDGTSSNVYQFAVTAPATVSAPTQPSGPTSGVVNTSYSYATSGAAASDGSSVQYRFSWGDGTYSNWLPVGTIAASHTWLTTGGYYVQSQARSAANPTLVSAFSPALSVGVSSSGGTPTSLNVTATVPSGSFAPASAVTVSGNVTYNTNAAVAAGTVTINTGEAVYTGAITNGSYSRVISAPSSSRNIQVSCVDSQYPSLTGSTNVYLSVLSNQVGSGYQLDRTTTCRDVESASPYDPIYETEFFRRSDPQAVVWADFTNLYVPIRARFDFYEPNGTLGASYTTPWTDNPASFGYLYWSWWKLWSWVTIQNSGAAYLPGRWACQMFVDSGSGWQYLQSQSFVIGYEFAEHRMAEGVETSPPYDPVNPTNVFLNSDQQALTWARLTNVVEGLNFQWDFYEPNGSHYATFDYAGPDPGVDYYYPDARFWGYINIVGTPAAQKTGNWRAVVSVQDPAGNYDPIYTDYFEIVKSTTDPPNASISLTPAAPAGGQPVTVNVSASDTTYLQKVVLSWNDGAVHTKTWDNIFAVSLDQAASIGPFVQGQQVDIWADAWDTSGYQRETAHSTVVIRPALTISGPSSLPSGVVGGTYASAIMTATGGTTPYRWSAAGLPAGLGIDATAGVISGVPSSNAGSPFSVTVSVTDAASGTASKSYSLTVDPRLTITGQPLSQSVASGQAALLAVTATGATPIGYQWYAGTSGSTSSPIVGATTNTFTTPKLTATTSYWVRVSNADGAVNSLTATIKVYQPFTDPILTSGVTPIRTIHISELRTRVNALRARVNLAAFAWTDPTLTPSVSVIRTVHISELRTALSQVYTAAGLTVPAFTDPTLTHGMTIKIAHIAELRSAVLAIE